METKKGLKPGMKVENVRTGKIGELRAEPDKPDQLFYAADYGVFIRRRLSPGGWSYSFWVLKNIELVEE